MLLTLGMAIVVLILVGVAVAVVNSDAAMPEAPRDLADVGLPGGRAMTPDDVADLRFSMGLRGYRMGEVDDALARLRDELAERDTEIAQLRKPRYADASVDTGPDDIVAIVDPTRDEEADDAVTPAAPADHADGEQLPLASPDEQVGEQLRETHG